jgi:hypothetical protein
MKRATIPERLGEIQTIALIEALANTADIPRAVADGIRLAYARGFIVTGVFELPIYETKADADQARLELQARVSRWRPGDEFDLRHPPGKKLISLILEPQQNATEYLY